MRYFGFRVSQMVMLCAAACLLVVSWREQSYNGATVAGLLFGLGWVATLSPARQFISGLLYRVCLDCRDGRHLSCEGCDCPVDHSVEERHAEVEAWMGERGAA